MTHGETLAKIDHKLNFIKIHRPKWYEADERQYLDPFNRHLDDQVRRIGKKIGTRGYKPPFQLNEPEGIRAAERGR